MSILRKLFSKKVTGTPDLEEVINAYGEYLGKGTSVERDVSELPFDKETIKAAVLKAISLTPNGPMKTQLETGFVSLADFQDLETLKSQNASISAKIADECEGLLAELKAATEK